MVGRCGGATGSICWLREFEFASERSASSERSRTLDQFHGVAEAQPRGWMVVRRLFGLVPVVVPKEFELDDLRVWPREELRVAMGVTRAQLAAELDAVRGAWRGLLVGMEPVKPVEVKAPASEFLFGDTQLLERYGFTMRFDSSADRNWFAGRVKDYAKMLDEKFTEGLARNALMNELRLHQLDGALNERSVASVGGAEYRATMKLRVEVDTQYQRQIAQLKELCPWAGLVAGKYAFSGLVSDITQAMQVYYRDGDNRLIDGIFTAAEVQVECRRSAQSPLPRYRAGWVVYAMAARAGLFNPNWKSTLPTSLLRRLDESWKTAMVAAGDATWGEGAGLGGGGCGWRVCGLGGCGWWRRGDAETRRGGAVKGTKRTQWTQGTKWLAHVAERAVESVRELRRWRRGAEGSERVGAVEGRGDESCCAKCACGAADYLLDVGGVFV